MTVRVLIVDDSATMRSLIAATLRQDPEIEVLGFANDPIEAREAIKRLNPDVITLDVEMPHMNGLDFLEKIMRLRPMPVVMVSTLTQQGAEVTLAAMELGAVDCVGKPSAGHTAAEAFSDLPDKVKAASRARVRPFSGHVTRVEETRAYKADDVILAIGSSTGGVEALMTILSAFPSTCPPTVITQHMPATFTRSFAERLDKVCGGKVAEAWAGARLAPGHVYLAPGGETHLEVTGSTTPVCRLRQDGPVNGHRPSVDVLFDSVARLNRPAVGVILTGMGRDGAQGLLAMRQAGARTLGQDEASSVVYGMPRAAKERLMPAPGSIKTLIADDQQSMRSLIRTSLHTLGITQTREVADGEDALRALLAQPANLVITDFNMPKLDGLGLLRAIRAHGPISKTAVIMLTGRADRELVQRAVQFGVNNYLVKPFTTQILKEKIEAVFGPLGCSSRTFPTGPAAASTWSRGSTTSPTMRTWC